MTKNEVLKIIAEGMNNREIDSIRNAILAIEYSPEYSSFAKLELRGHNDLCCLSPFFQKQSMCV